MFASRWHMGISPEALSIRRAVFVEEQGVLIAVPDGFDAYAMQLVVEEDGVPVASARLVPEDGGLRLSFVAVLPQYRGQGFGDLCVRQALYKARQMHAVHVCIDVLEQNVPYYRAFGFERTGGPGAGKIPMRVETGRILWHPPCKEQEETV